MENLQTQLSFSRSGVAGAAGLALEVFKNWRWKQFQNCVMTVLTLLQIGPIIPVLIANYSLGPRL